MATESDPRPWDALEQLASSGDARQLQQFIDSLAPGEAVRALTRLSTDAQRKMLILLPARRAAELLTETPEVEATEMLEHLPPEDAAAILAEMPSDEQADLITGLSEAEAESILHEMPEKDAAEARALASYAADEAGGLMITEYLAYPEMKTTGAVLDDLRTNAQKYADYDVQYVYVISQFGDLVGVLRLRDLLLTRPDRPISDMMIRKPLAVDVHATLDELAALFGQVSFLGVPVIDRGGHLCGVVRRSDVDLALADRADRSFLRFQGIVAGEELRTMPVKSRVWRRLSWLSCNLVLDLVAVSVIAVYENTLAAVIALAVFLPLISDMSGNAGIQAIAISLRELTLGLLKPREIIWVCMKEAAVGIINGAILGLLVALVGWGYTGNPWFGAVIGGAMAINTVIAVLAGGSIPLILKRLRLDPALASGPLLTTITDMVGFFLVLSFATLALSKLAPA
jgi:magnesium transporter